MDDLFMLSLFVSVCSEKALPRLTPVPLMIQGEASYPTDHA
jgi:hypothetical protein